MAQGFREISIFVAHSYTPKSEAYAPESFRKAINSLKDRVQERLNIEQSGIGIQTILEVHALGNKLPAQIENEIEACHFGIADISDNSPNVVFELGQLVARGIQHVVIKSKESEKEFPIPVDLSNKTICFYNNIAEIGDLLFDEVVQNLRRVLKGQSLRSSYLNNIWFPTDTRYIHCITSSELTKTSFADRSSPNYIYMDNLGDKDALLETMVFLSRCYPHSRIIKYAADDFPAKYIEDNLVVIGGPGEIDGEGNAICRQMMQRVRSKVTYSEDCEVLLYGGHEFRADQDSKAYITRDYGYFARFPNPLNFTSSVVLINGIHTFGVLGAVKAFSDHPLAQLNIRKVIDVLNYKNLGELAFECFFPVDVVVNEPICPEIDSAKVSRIETSPC